ncbi:hypothetical protein GCM10010302_09250 [Streptomyces polychromogenes]|uniref:Uncharacterized protein n=1 Tax=Streptomyces polychromogenes TaxID=67342 RepID=A0ABP3EQ70_9ACTN
MVALASSSLQRTEPSVRPVSLRSMRAESATSDGGAPDALPVSRHGARTVSVLLAFQLPARGPAPWAADPVQLRAWSREEGLTP